MTKEEALKLLETAPQSETKPAAINKVLSQKQAVDLIKNGIFFRFHADNCVLPELYEKRVWQIVKNQKRPRY
jgi:hypothetical protein